MKHHILATFICAVAIGFFIPSPSFADEVRVVGSTTVNAVLFNLHKDDLEKQTGLTLKVIPNGSGHGLEDLLKGNADVAMISASLDSEKGKLTTEGKDTLVENAIGTSTVAFITSKDSKVTSLTSEQAKGILDGDITDWSKVGGDAGPITIIAEVAGGGIRSSVEKSLLGGPIKVDVKSVANGNKVVKIVAQLPGSLGITAIAMAGDSVKVLPLDKPIQQPLALVTKGAPSANVAKLIEAAKNLGIK